MKNIIKVNNIEDAKSSPLRPIMALDNNKELFIEGKKYIPEGFVDLGLPSGTLWAKCNIGAQIETDSGDYYQWATTTPFSINGTTVSPAANWETYPYSDNSGTYFTKYNGESTSNVLESSDDVVTKTFGNGYKIPHHVNFTELIQNTNNEYTTINNINGYKFINKNDSTKYIFLPTSGYCWNTLLSEKNNTGYCSASDFIQSACSSASILMFNDE